MSFTTENLGRLGNQIIRNLAVNFIAEKHDLYVVYSSNKKINDLGIKLFSGQNRHKKTLNLTDNNYFQTLDISNLRYNINANNNYFQTLDISNYIYNYLKNIKDDIIMKNRYKNRYKNNNDIFIHIRLGDVADRNPGYKYYKKCLELISNYDNIYISSDTPNHEIITKIKNNFENTEIINFDEIETIQFGSTCNNIILSHGSFSAVIGYLSFFSNNIYYPGDGWPNGWGRIELFEDKNWNPIPKN